MSGVRQFVAAYAGVLALYVAFVFIVAHCPIAAAKPTTTTPPTTWAPLTLADCHGSSEEAVWRAALSACRARREIEVCRREGSPDCDLVRMANASEYQAQKPADELRRCLEPGAGLFLTVDALQ
jgi:hypothetical protein